MNDILLNRLNLYTFINTRTSKMADPDETQVISSPYHRDYGDEKKNSSVAYFGGKFKIKIGPFCMKGNFNCMYQLGKSNLRNSL